MNKREFILNTLIGYKNDPSTCAIDNHRDCMYLVHDGRKCAVGKHLKEGIHQQHVGNVGSLIEKYGENIFTDEARQYNLSEVEWKLMQRYHDGIALGLYNNYYNQVVKDLEHETKLEFPELIFQEDVE